MTKARVLLCDVGDLKKGQVVELASWAEWNRLFPDWKVTTAPLGAKEVGQLGMEFAAETPEDEAAAVIMTLRGREHSTSWIARQLGIDRATVDALAQRQVPVVDADVVTKLRGLLRFQAPRHET